MKKLIEKLSNQMLPMGLCKVAEVRQSVAEMVAYRLAHTPATQSPFMVSKLGTLTHSGVAYDVLVEHNSDARIVVSVMDTFNNFAAGRMSTSYQNMMISYGVYKETEKEVGDLAKCKCHAERYNLLFRLPFVDWEGVMGDPNVALTVRNLVASAIQSNETYDMWEMIETGEAVYDVNLYGEDVGADEGHMNIVIHATYEGEDGCMHRVDDCIVGRATVRLPAGCNDE